MSYPRDHAQRAADRPAVIFAPTNTVLSYGALERQANRAAHLLRALGLRRGDTVALLAEDRPLSLVLAWAAQRAGLYLVPLYTSSDVAKLTAVVHHCDADLLIASSCFADSAMAALAGLERNVRLLVMDGDREIEDVLDGAAGHPLSDAPIDDEAPGEISFYSAGTTGAPRGIRPPLTNGPVDAPDPVTQIAATLFGFSADTRLSLTAPLYHVAPLRNAMAVHRLGGTVVLLGSFEPKQALADLARLRITHSHWVPHMLTALVKLDPAERARHDLSSHRLAVHGAAPCPPSVKRALIEWWGPIVHEFYSGTEGIGMCAISSEEWLQRPGSVGRSLLGPIMILDDQGRVLPPGRIGGIWFAEPRPFAYHKDAAATAAVFDDRGWASLGDIGHLDEDGYLMLTDRKANAIDLNGRLIWPRLIEDRLMEHDAVLDAGVTVSGRDGRTGPLTAILALAPTRSTAGLHELACAIAAEQGILLQLVVVPSQSFPRDDDGKLNRSRLRALAAECEPA